MNGGEVVSYVTGTETVSGFIDQNKYLELYRAVEWKLVSLMERKCPMLDMASVAKKGSDPAPIKTNRNALIDFSGARLGAK